MVIKMYIRDIEPIGDASVNLLEDSSDIIDKIIELPLREACRIFKEKGIQTVMSSANKTNLVLKGEKVIEKEDLGNNPLETHLFLEAGKGYAWIMLNFNSLSKENKDLLFELEERKNDNGDAVGEKLIWFVHPFEMQGNIEYGLRTGRFNYDYLKMCLPEEDIPLGIEVDDSLIEFEKRHITLLYPWTDSSSEAVFLRMPINNKTTVEEVNEYFVEFAKCFHSQKYVDEKSGNKNL